MKNIAIGDLARAASTKIPTIRYYEAIGLIDPLHRSGGGRRVYGPDEVERLKFIRHSRELGFGITAIRELLKLSDHPDTSCAAADIIAKAQLEQVEIRLTKLRALQKELKRMVTECGHGRVSQCRVINVLRDHRYCSTDH